MLKSGDVAALAGCSKATVFYALRAGDIECVRDRQNARLFEDEDARRFAVNPAAGR